VAPVSAPCIDQDAPRYHAAIELEFDPTREALSAFDHVPWRRYVAIGDSTTEGLGEPTPGYPDIGWAEMVGLALKAVRPELEFHSLGQRFMTSKQVRESQLEPALALDPDLVSVVVGGNDMLVRKFDPGITERELEAIVAPFVQRGATVLTCTMFNIFGAGVMHPDAVAYMEPRFQAMNERIRAVAARHKLPLVDLALDPISLRVDMYSKDLQHATRLGHAATAELIVRELAQHVREPEVVRPD
jgi:lysophospholipase L1-like esterase